MLQTINPDVEGMDLKKLFEAEWKPNESLHKWNDRYQQLVAAAGYPEQQALILWISKLPMVQKMLLQQMKLTGQLKSLNVACQFIERALGHDMTYTDLQASVNNNYRSKKLQQDTNSNSNSQLRCFNCHQLGHLKAACLLNNNRKSLNMQEN